MAKNEMVDITEYERLKQENEMLKAQNVACLGDGQVFVKRSQGGIIRAIKGQVLLEERNGEIATIQGKTMVTSKGFAKANQLAGLSIITPDRMLSGEGKFITNPYPILDEQSQTVTKILVKKMAVGYSPIGNLVISTATLMYDIKMYFVQDLVNKVHSNKAAGRISMFNSITEEDRKKGDFFRIEGDLGVFVDFSNPDILQALKTFMQKKTFGERNAQSICERLVFSKHPALAHIAYVNPSGQDKNQTAKVTIFGYVFEVSKEELDHIKNAAEKGEEISVKGREIQTVDVGVVSATSEEMVVETDDEEIAHQSAETADRPDILKGEGLFGQ